MGGQRVQHKGLQLMAVTLFYTHCCDYPTSLHKPLKFHPSSQWFDPPQIVEVGRFFQQLFRFLPTVFCTVEYSHKLKRLEDLIKNLVPILADQAAQQSLLQGEELEHLNQQQLRQIRGTIDLHWVVVLFIDPFVQKRSLLRSYLLLLYLFVA